MGQVQAADNSTSVRGSCFGYVFPDYDFSVLNTFKSMITEDDGLEKEDMYILDKMKDFLTSEEASKFPASKSLMNVIDRAVRHIPSPILDVSYGSSATEWRQYQDLHQHNSRTTSTSYRT